MYTYSKHVYFPHLDSVRQLGFLSSCVAEILPPSSVAHIFGGVAWHQHKSVIALASHPRNKKKRTGDKAHYLLIVYIAGDSRRLVLIRIITRTIIDSRRYSISEPVVTY
jgi:hypothetical protein